MYLRYQKRTAQQEEEEAHITNKIISATKEVHSKEKSKYIVFIDTLCASE